MPANYIPWRECPACRREFYADADWKKLCFDCWKEAQRGSPRSADTATLRAEIARLRCELAELRGLAGRAESGRYRAGRAGAGIDAEMLKRLIALCHPDRHQGSTAATVATQWLLSQREATR